MSLSAFLAENALSVENVKFVASKRFLSDELDDKASGSLWNGRSRPLPAPRMKPSEVLCQAVSRSRQEKPVSEGNRL